MQVANANLAASQTLLQLEIATADAGTIETAMKLQATAFKQLAAAASEKSRPVNQGRSWWDVHDTLLPEKQFVAKPATAVDAALDTHAAAEGGQKDWRDVPPRNATDSQGRPFWNNEGTVAAHYIELPIGTSNVEVMLALGGVGRLAGAAGHGVAGVGRSANMWEGMSSEITASDTPGIGSICLLTQIQH